MDGLTQFADFEVKEQLFKAVGGSSSLWGLQDPRFYRIVKKEAFSKLDDSIKTIVKSWKRRLN